jgi:hypothetical protein
MSAKRLRLEIAGELIVGLAFRNEAELERFLLDHCIFLDDLPPPARAMHPASAAGGNANGDVDDGAGPGRPSFAAAIAAAVEHIGAALHQHGKLAARARLVLRVMAKNTAQDDLPSQRVVERYLAGHAPRQNFRRKSRQNPKRDRKDRQEE